MAWDDDDDLTEPDESDYDRPLMGVTGGQRARPGDTYTLRFEDDGERVETDQGKRMAADAVLEESSFRPITSDGEDIEEGDPVRFMTGSARFLAQLKDHTPLSGTTVEVEVEGTGYDAAYRIVEV